MDLKIYFRSRQGEMLHFLKKLVELESPTENKAAVDACSSYLAGELRKTGCKIKTIKQTDVGDFHAIEYSRGGRIATSRPLFLLVHADTVWPAGKLLRMPFFVSADKVYGPGVLDMKAGLVMAYFAISTIHALNLTPQRKIILFVNSAEETGNENAHKEIKKLAKTAAMALCLEPALPGGALKLERKGRVVLRLETSGRAAHAGSPEKGINAIEEIMYQIRELKKAARGGTTLNIGKISGGERPNVVAEKAEALLDVRFWKSTDRQKVVTSAKTLSPSQKGAGLKVSVVNYTPPMERTSVSNRLFERASEMAMSMGMELKAGRTGGGSDGSIVSAMGIPTLDGLGPDGDGIHAANEHLIIPSLVDRTALLTALLEGL